MADSRFIYVTYIRTTPEKLWQALLDPEFNRKWWSCTTQECDWKPGASWKLRLPDGRLAGAGEVLEIEPQRKIVLKWRSEAKPEHHAEGFTRATFTLEPQGETVKLTVRHEIDIPESKMIQAVTNGWPLFLSGLKSLLETGQPLEATSTPKQC